MTPFYIRNFKVTFTMFCSALNWSDIDLMLFIVIHVVNVKKKLTWQKLITEREPMYVKSM